MKIPMKKTHCSYCGSDSITEVQFDQNFENFKAASKYAWVGLTDEEYLEAESVVWVTINLDSDEKEANREFYKAIETKLKEKNT